MKYLDHTGLTHLVEKLKAWVKEWVASVTYACYLNETTGDLIALNEAGASIQITLDENTGDIILTT